MELVKGAKPRISGKRFYIKSNGLCGKVASSSEYLVTAKFDNGKIKVYTRTNFEKLAEIIKAKPQRRELPKSDVKDFKAKCLKVITHYINTHFKYDDIVINFTGRSKAIVTINGTYCGEMKLDKNGLQIKFKTHIPPPNISEFKIKTDYDIHTYYFTNLSKEGISAIQTAINWLLLCGKERHK